jgi:hypothetical protein
MRPVEKLQEFRAADFLAAKTGQVGRGNLAVNKEKAGLKQFAGKGKEGGF